MPTIRLKRDRSVVIVLDIQPGFLGAIHDADRVVDRSSFLVEVACLLGVPVIATVQNRTRLGGIHPRLAALEASVIDKLSFSCWGSDRFRESLSNLDRSQVLVVGIETHICVSQTALDLLAAGYEVAVCPDAVSAGTLERHKLGMERIRDAGVVPVHSEAAAYEWLGTASDPGFRSILDIVKANRG